jgi:acetyl-CoA acetyltransferase
MAFKNVEIPYGAYWSSPFLRWQGAFGSLPAQRFAGWVAKRELERRGIDPGVFDSGVLGMTVPQHRSYFGAATPLYELGATHAPGHMLSQICATGARALFAGVSEVALGLSNTTLLLAADRNSNSTQLYYPDPNGPGGVGVHENVIMDNMSDDPIGHHSMTVTAENVAKKRGIGTEAQHEVVLRRFEQYQDALKDGQAFQKRFMTLPFEIPRANFKAVAGAVEGDVGVAPTTRESLAKLKPVLAGGTVTYAGQTHPADGNAAIIVTTSDRAHKMSRDPSIRVRVRGFGQARVDNGYMPEAPIGAARQALAQAELEIGGVNAIKTHNPFVVNDIAFAQELGVDVNSMNNFGSSLVWGHPSGATGMRLIIELIEELALRGGGTGLMTGCAGGDQAMAAVIEVDGR